TSPEPERSGYLQDTHTFRRTRPGPVLGRPRGMPGARHKSVVSATAGSRPSQCPLRSGKRPKCCVLLKRPANLPRCSTNNVAILRSQTAGEAHQLNLVCCPRVNDGASRVARCVERQEIVE